MNLNLNLLLSFSSIFFSITHDRMFLFWWEMEKKEMTQIKMMLNDNRYWFILIVIVTRLHSMKSSQAFFFFYRLYLITDIKSDPMIWQ